MIKIFGKDIYNRIERGTDKSIGYDIRANNDKPILLEPGDWKLIPTGLYSYMSFDHEYCDIRPRSGLAYKHGITVLNSPGTIDADYTGEWGVLLINLGRNNFEVTQGMRIAQLIPHANDELIFVSNDNPKESCLEEHSGKRRGGFGSTGTN